MCDEVLLTERRWGVYCWSPSVVAYCISPVGDPKFTRNIVRTLSRRFGQSSPPSDPTHTYAGDFDGFVASKKARATVANPQT